MNSTRTFNPAMSHLLRRRGLLGLGDSPTEATVTYFVKPKSGTIKVGDHPSFSGKRFTNVTVEGPAGTKGTDWDWSETQAWFGPSSNPTKIYVYASATTTPTTPPAPTGPTFEQQRWVDTAREAIRQAELFHGRLLSGQIDPSTSFTYTLSSPPTGTPNGSQLYEEFRGWVASFDAARNVGRISWQTPTTPTAPTAPTSPTSPGTSTYPGPYTFPNAGTDVYDVQYSAGSLVLPGRAQATIVPMGGSTTPDQNRSAAAADAAAPASGGGGALILLGLAVAGGGVYLWRRRKSRSR